jgi:response regulator RpfG family c-di-GMP phosphodiesterase
LNEKNPRTKNIPVLFLTSLISKKEEFENSTSNRYFLAKPIEKDKLLKVVASGIEEPSIKKA